MFMNFWDFVLNQDQNTKIAAIVVNLSTYVQ